MRLFVALSIGAGVRDRLASFLDELRRADPKTRWAAPQNLHVTLKFIGAVADQRLPDIVLALSRVSAPSPVALEFGGIGFFPDDRRPAVVWAGIQAPPELALLAARVEEALLACAVPRDTRRFAPHLTLARLKEPRLPETLRTLLAHSRSRGFGVQSFAEFQLMESKTKPAGAEYTTLNSFPFAAREKQP